LLTHTSGLPEWHPFYLYHPTGRIGLDAFKQLPPAYPPGKKVLYSCVGYMLLCSILEKVAGLELERLAADVLFRPLGLANTFLAVPESRRDGCAPTEMGNAYEKRMGQRFDRYAAARYPWRTAVIRGQTHDVNSFHQGGFAGNAGLFADVRDVWRLALEFFPESATIIDRRSIELFWMNFTPRFRTHRSIGFKLNSSFVTSGGPALARDAIGHNGFTGTSLWLEKASGRIWILLANRIHPRVPAGAFDPVRRRLHHLLRRELDRP
jgi:CubicO group peptidase (beta-lactamase class C family)